MALHHIPLHCYRSPGGTSSFFLHYKGTYDGTYLSQTRPPSPPPPQTGSPLSVELTSTKLSRREEEEKRSEEGSGNLHTWRRKLIYHCCLTAGAQVIASVI